MKVKEIINKTFPREGKIVIQKGMKEIDNFTLDNIKEEYLNDTVLYIRALDLNVLAVNIK